MENSLIYGTGSPHRKSAKGANVSTVEQESSPDVGSEESVIVTTTLVLTVVGAGRGPLVAAALSASSLTNIPIRVYAIEKNANAVITLRNRAITEFWSNVTIVSTDMRDWVPPELCDILVSELLGSFGDNELSPECLDGAQKCLKHDGVSIPHNYTSFIAPIATSKLWNTAKAFNSSNSTISNGLDTAYVVRFKSAYQFATAQSLFVFEHPNRDKKIDNTRYAEVVALFVLLCKNSLCAWVNGYVPSLSFGVTSLLFLLIISSFLLQVRQSQLHQRDGHGDARYRRIFRECTV